MLYLKDRRGGAFPSEEDYGDSSLALRAPLGMTEGGGFLIKESPYIPCHSEGAKRPRNPHIASNAKSVSGGRCHARGGGYGVPLGESLAAL